MRNEKRGEEKLSKVGGKFHGGKFQFHFNILVGLGTTFLSANQISGLGFNLAPEFRCIERIHCLSDKTPKKMFIQHHFFVSAPRTAHFYKSLAK